MREVAVRSQPVDSRRARTCLELDRYEALHNVGTRFIDDDRDTGFDRGRPVRQPDMSEQEIFTSWAIRHGSRPFEPVKRRDECTSRGLSPA